MAPTYDPTYKYRYIRPDRLEEWKMYEWEEVDKKEMVEKGYKIHSDLVLVRRTWTSLEKKVPESARPTKKEIRDVLKATDQVDKPPNPQETLNELKAAGEAEAAAEQEHPEVATLEERP